MAAGRRVRYLEWLCWAAALTALAVVVFRTAWLSDDAYITLRTIDNWRAGFGLRWNPAERVQAFTHPLWLFAEAAAWTLTGEHFFSTLALSILCALGAAALLTVTVRPVALGAAALVLLLCSQTFVDYATSGLETPLTYLLLAAFLTLYWRPRGRRPLFWSILLASLLLLNRIDAGILLAPPLLHLLIRVRRTQAWGALAGFLPFALWEAFSIVYYGVPVPNTAFAKLATGISQAQLTAQGLRYLANSWHADPIALSTIAAAVALACWRPRLVSLLAAAGIALHVVYVVRIGGDFMSGRFLAPAMFAALGLLLHHPVAWPQRATVAGVLLLLAGVTAPQAFRRERFLPPYPPVDALIDAHGIADERRIYVRETSLRQAIRRGAVPHPALEQVGLQMRALGPAVIPRDAIGLLGFGAGPQVHIVDVLGLGDPLIARLPAREGWRIGHFYRDIPAGYMDVLRGRREALADPALEAYYRDVRLLTRGPLWTRARWAAILRLNVTQRIWKSES